MPRDTSGRSTTDLRILLAPGSSLGGARPKASIRDSEGHLSIAKFPRKDDLYSVGAWEHLALTMAQAAGIRVAESALLSVEGQDIILLSRFDRDGERRTPFLSAMSLLDGVDQEPRTEVDRWVAMARGNNHVGILERRAPLHKRWYVPPPDPSGPA